MGGWRYKPLRAKLDSSQLELNRLVVQREFMKSYGVIRKCVGEMGE